jgi:hypothetical protein
MTSEVSTGAWEKGGRLGAFAVSPCSAKAYIHAIPRFDLQELASVRPFVVKYWIFCGESGLSVLWEEISN